MIRVLLRLQLPLVTSDKISAEPKVVLARHRMADSHSFVVDRGSGGQSGTPRVSHVRVPERRLKPKAKGHRWLGPAAKGLSMRVRANLTQSQVGHRGGEGGGDGGGGRVCSSMR
jgi:hypothetical protein